MCEPEHSPMPYKGALILSRRSTIDCFDGVCSYRAAHDKASSYCTACSAVHDHHGKDNAPATARLHQQLLL